MKPLIVTFIMTITFPNEPPKRFEVPVKGADAQADCARMVLGLFKGAEKETDGRTVSVECKASR